MQIINKPSPAGPVKVERPSITIDTKQVNPVLNKLKAKIEAERRSPHADSIRPPVLANQQPKVAPKPAPESYEPQPSGLKEGSQVSSQPQVEELSPQAEASQAKPLDPQLTMLARQQRALRKAQQELKAQQEAWKQEQAKYVPRDMLTSDPLKVLTEAGITQDKLVELQLNQANPPSDTELLRQEIADLKKQLAGVDEKFVSRDKQAYDQAILAFKRDAELLVSSDPAFETLKALGSEGTEAVVELIKKQFSLDGRILDVESAAKEVEEAAVEREYARTKRLMGLAKIKQRLAPPIPAPSVSEGNGSQQESSSQSNNTLTNQMGVGRPLTARERAILAFQAANKK